jgi:hypothetical protein
MRKLLNLLLLVALAIGFVSCEPVENTDGKYESKLVGKWNATSIKGILSQGSLVLQEEVITLPAEGKCESVVFDFKKDGTFELIVVFADGDKDIEEGEYSVVDGVLIMRAKGGVRDNGFLLVMIEMVHCSYIITPNGVCAVLAFVFEL